MRATWDRALYTENSVAIIYNDGIYKIAQQTTF